MSIHVVGVGSSHGDDQAAWLFIERCQGRLGVRRIVALSDPSRLIDHLDCQMAIVVDACRSGAPPGTISRLEWPDQRISSQHSHSTHGLSVADVLHLATRLDRLPSTVVVFGVEVCQCRSGEPPNRAVQRGLAELEQKVLQEIQRFRDASTTT